MAVTGDRADVIREPEQALETRDATHPVRKNADTAGVLLIVATAAGLLSGPFLALVTSTSHDPAIAGTAPVVSLPTARLGRALGWTTAVVGLVSAVLGYTTPPRSRPFCRSGCVGAPYTDVAAFVPRDYWWLYPQSRLVLLMLGLLVCVHQAASPQVRVFSGLAVLLTTAGATALLADYAIQPAVLQPSLWRGETSGLSLLSQYNPHGVFIALEDLGYVLLGLALLTAAAVFTVRSRLERSLHWVLLTGGTLTVIALPALVAVYGSDLEYRYEVAAIAFTWITLMAGGMLLTRWFHRPAGPAPGG